MWHGNDRARAICVGEQNGQSLTTDGLSIEKLFVNHFLTPS